MKFVLILMVKNESRILKRCLESVEGVVDAFCITDTGSTDNTVEIANEFLKTRTGIVATSEWKNFGYNRTVSFNVAHDFLRDKLGWNLAETYGLLLDADMQFVPGTLKEQTLDAFGYTVIQKAGTLEYPNCRLIRMDYLWTCKGVTHEYWDGSTKALPASVCCIQDHNDGGCKSDKFARDARLLEQGLIEEPHNVRYMFYLAQTYNSLGRYKDAIQMYKKRIAGGGWFEEVWYSHYMIANCHHALKNYAKFEEWMLRAYAYRSQRAESLYKLTKHFREQAQHYKAYQYLEMGSGIPIPDDSLFIERDVYDYLFDYERSILDFYVREDKRHGLRSSMRYMLKTHFLQHSVVSNLVFYVRPLGTVTALSLPRPFGEAYRPSAISLREYPLANVRYINYWMETGDYKTPPGECVRTENAFVNLETGEVLATMKDASITLPRREVAVKGLEDVRLYGDNRFVATVQEYTEGVHQLDGVYDVSTGTYQDVAVLPSPTNRSCEKNWLPIPGTNSFVYDWHPFQTIGTLAKTYPVPPFFALLRGSAPPVQRNGEWWVLAHFVDHTKPRRYYHCVVVLDETFRPVRVSLPFVFKSPGVEYCISTRFVDSALECYVSFEDTNPSRVVIPVSDLAWNSIEVSRDTSQ